MSGTADFRLTRDDLLSAARLNHRAALGSRRTVLIVVGFAAIVGVAAFFLARPEDHPGLVGPGAAAGTVIYLYTIFVVVGLIRIPLAVAQRLREQRNLHDVYTITWSEQSYKVVGATAQSDIPWDHYVAWRENGRVLLLYQAAQFFQIVPKSALPPAAIDAMRGYLVQAGVRKGRIF